MWWAAYATVYVLFTRFAWDEIIAGALIAAAAVALSRLASGAAGSHFGRSAPRL